MSHTLMSYIKDYLKAHGILNLEFTYERCASSVAGHIFNMVNTADPVYWDKGLPQNFRIHIVFIIPSGFGKSLAIETFLDPATGLLSQIDDIPTSLQGTFSKESWLGTIERDPDTGENILTGGVFDTHKDGIIGADEFQKITILMSGDGENHDEVYLLQALSRSSVSKALAHGAIQVDGICTTLWAGMRPAEVTTHSGFGRRLAYQYFFPTRQEAEMFNEMASEDTMSPNKPDRQAQDKVWYMVKAWANNMRNQLKKTMPEFDLTEFNLWCKAKNIQHFDMGIYKRIAIGITLANLSREVPSKIKLKASTFAPLLDSEYWSRSALKDSVYNTMAYRIVSAENGEITLQEFEDFLLNSYQFTRKQVKDVLIQAKGQDGIIEIGSGHKLWITDKGRRRFPHV
jgi:hypothetical protein